MGWLTFEKILTPRKVLGAWLLIKTPESSRFELPDHVPDQVLRPVMWPEKKEKESKDQQWSNRTVVL